MRYNDTRKEEDEERSKKENKRKKLDDEYNVKNPFKRSPFSLSVSVL